jgi:hypothetical protein
MVVLKVWPGALFACMTTLCHRKIETPNENGIVN